MDHLKQSSDQTLLDTKTLLPILEEKLDSILFEGDGGAYDDGYVDALHWVFRQIIKFE